MNSVPVVSSLWGLSFAVALPVPVLCLGEPGFDAGGVGSRPENERRIFLARPQPECGVKGEMSLV